MTATAGTGAEVSRDLALRMYTQMVRIRAFEE